MGLSKDISGKTDEITSEISKEFELFPKRELGIILKTSIYLLESNKLSFL
jgi:hypothetical protein